MGLGTKVLPAIQRFKAKVDTFKQIHNWKPSTVRGNLMSKVTALSKVVANDERLKQAVEAYGYEYNAAAVGGFIEKAGSWLIMRGPLVIVALWAMAFSCCVVAYLVYRWHSTYRQGYSTSGEVTHAFNAADDVEMNNPKAALYGGARE